jgi:hypothetical protein
MVKSNFRERPEMIRLREAELAWLKRFEIPEHPLKAVACKNFGQRCFNSRKLILKWRLKKSSLNTRIRYDQ